MLPWFLSDVPVVLLMTIDKQFTLTVTIIPQLGKRLDYEIVDADAGSSSKVMLQGWSLPSRLCLSRYVFGLSSTFTTLKSCQWPQGIK